MTDTMNILQAPPASITDLIKSSKAYRMKGFSRHRAKTLTFDDFEIKSIRQPKHRKQETQPRHRTWDIEQS